MNPLDKKVYEAVSRKDLSFGCRILIDGYDEMRFCWGEEFSSERYAVVTEMDGECYWYEGYFEKEIIGHPILLSDVMNWGGDKTGTFQYYWDLSLPTYDEQSEECKEFIRNLVK